MAQCFSISSLSKSLLFNCSTLRIKALMSTDLSKSSSCHLNSTLIGSIDLKVVAEGTVEAEQSKTRRLAVITCKWRYEKQTYWKGKCRKKDHISNRTVKKSIDTSASDDGGWRTDWGREGGTGGWKDGHTHSPTRAACRQHQTHQGSKGNKKRKAIASCTNQLWKHFN